MSADFPSSDPNGRRTATGSEPRPAPVEDLQTSPSPAGPPPIPPMSSEPLANGPPPEALGRVRRSPAATKLRILLRCHDVAARARGVRALVRLGRGAAVILLGAVLGVLAALGVFAAVYDNPEQYAQRYYDPNTGAYTYFIKGENVSQQRYDYFLATGSNLTTAVSAATAVGLMVLALFAGSLSLRVRRPEPSAAGGVDEQIAAIVRDHPEAVREWGGPSVLREPYLVAEILRIEEKNGR